MSLPTPPDKYDRAEQMKVRAQIDRMDAKNRKKGQDVEIAGSERLIITSPNGLRWVVTASNGGALSLVAA